MKQFEYKIHKTQKPSFFNRSYGNVEKELNALGHQGWELVSTAVFKELGWPTIVSTFKRETFQ